MLFYEGHKVYMDGNYPAIFKDGKNRHVHRLEWEKHHGKIPSNCIIHHKDENRLNWSIDNLECLTRSEHIYRHKNRVHRKGVKVIAKKDGLEIEFDSIEKAAKFCKVYTSAIGRIMNNKQRQSNGWTFKRGGK